MDTWIPDKKQHSPINFQASEKKISDKKVFIWNTWLTFRLAESGVWTVAEVVAVFPCWINVSMKRKQVLSGLSVSETVTLQTKTEQQPKPFSNVQRKLA